jgi:hypothetical protein
MGMRDRKIEGNSLSGWCSAAPGARVVHTGCRAIICTCECHDKREDAA